MTPNLKLELVAANQAQKHVTVNEALVALDSLAQLAASNRTQPAPPASPAQGETYIVGPSPTGAFAGRAGEIAVFDEGVWRFHAPADGWRCYVLAEDILLVRSGGQWRPAGLPLSPTSLGINTTADAVNRLALRSAGSLFDHVGAGHRLAINKAAVGETASLLLQTGYSGRAEIGLAGDDRLRLKVSQDGQAWKDAITVEPASGLAQVVGSPVAANGIATRGSVEQALASYAQPFDYQLATSQTITQLGVWTPIANISTARIASSAFDTAQSRFVAPADGFYVVNAQIMHTAGPAGTTITASATRNGAPAGNWASQSIGANQQSSLTLMSILRLTANDSVRLAIYAQSTTTISQGFTSLFGHRL